MRTPTVIVAGQKQTDRVCDALLKRPGTIVVRHRFDGQVVIRAVSIRRDEKIHVSERALELSNGDVGATTTDDLLVLLRRLHRREDVDRIVVHLGRWIEPEPVCWAINNVEVRVGPGYPDGPAALDVGIEAVISVVEAESWLAQALSDDTFDDDRTVAQIVVDQAEFADVVLLAGRPDRSTIEVLRRLTPRGRLTSHTDRLETLLGSLGPTARRGADHCPHAPLLAGQPPLHPEGDVRIVGFNANRPFHPMRLHAAIDELLSGVVRIRGRAWLASKPDAVVWIESAGGGLRVGYAGEWLATMAPEQRAEESPERTAMASLLWSERFGDRHIAMTALVCGAHPDAVTRSLRGALLTDDELSAPQTWADYFDPFGDWHEDPCDDFDTADRDVPGRDERDDRA